MFARVITVENIEYNSETYSFYYSTNEVSGSQWFTWFVLACLMEYEPINYSISFDGNGADGEMDAITATYDEEYTLTANTFTRTGYTFTGWNTEADGSGTSYEDGATVSNLTTEDGATVTLYAQWEENETVNVNITKISSKTEEELEGVEFRLYELICEDDSHTHDTSEDLIDANDYDTTCWNLIDTYITGADGIFTLSNIDPTGIYRLVETKTVDNYLLPTGQWKIEFDYDDNLDEDKAVTVSGVTLQITGISNPPAVTAGDDTIYIYNNSNYDIPTTGAMGTEDYITIGAIIILVGVIGKIHKSKKTVGLRSSRIKTSKTEAKNIKRISKMQKRCRKMQKKTEKMLKK